MNTDKTKYMSYNTNQNLVIKSIDGSNQKIIDNLKYLGAWIDISAKDLKFRKAIA